MASAIRKSSPSKRDRKLGARHPDSAVAPSHPASAVKNAVAALTKNGRENTTGPENRPAKIKGFAGAKDPAPGVAENAAEARVPPALPVPIASFTF